MSRVQQIARPRNDKRKQVTFSVSHHSVYYNGELLRLTAERWTVRMHSNAQIRDESSMKEINHYFSRILVSCVTKNSSSKLFTSCCLLQLLNFVYDTLFQHLDFVHNVLFQNLDFIHNPLFQHLNFIHNLLLQKLDFVHNILFE